jgi:26S proteasome regulatory subunit N7
LTKPSGTVSNGTHVLVLTAGCRLIDAGGDWDRRNRLKAYNGIYLISIRSFAPAADLLLDVLSTFTSTELMPFEDVVKYAVIAGTISLARVDLKTKVIDSPEVLQILPGHPVLEPLDRLINCMYVREYSMYFHALAEVEGILKKDRYLASHTRVYVREMRRKAYAQLLESYRSLSIDFMAEQFGVTRDFIDAYLSAFPLFD